MHSLENRRAVGEYESESGKHRIRKGAWVNDEFERKGSMPVSSSTTTERSA